MLTVLSPAKSLKPVPAPRPATAPRLTDATDALLPILRGLGADDIAALMRLSPKLAQLNRDRYRDWEAAPTHPAAFLFAGDTYVGLEARTLSDDALRHAQGHLRILSGLYGLLRPLDAIRPYRLEMGTRLANPRGRDLYAFWGTRIAEALNADAEAAGTGWVLNCASVEYFGAVDRDALRPGVITPTFLEDRPGGPKVVSFHAKRARGAMARFVAEHRITDPADLRGFDAGGYAWQDSPAAAPVFLRRTEAAEAA